MCLRCGFYDIIIVWCQACLSMFIHVYPREHVTLEVKERKDQRGREREGGRVNYPF